MTTAAAAETSAHPPAGPYGRRHPFRFLAQDCPQTLGEGMAEFSAAQPELLVPDDPTLARFFHAHDACHVVFGLTTDIVDEALADTWTLVGTDMRVRRYFKYLAEPALRQLLVDIGFGRALVGLARAVPRLVEVLLRSRAMTAPWPFWGYEAFVDTPISALRERFNIRVV